MFKVQLLICLQMHAVCAIDVLHSRLIRILSMHASNASCSCFCAQHDQKPFLLFRLPRHGVLQLAGWTALNPGRSVLQQGAWRTDLETGWRVAVRPFDMLTKKLSASQLTANMPVSNSSKLRAVHALSLSRGCRRFCKNLSPVSNFSGC